MQKTIKRILSIFLAIILIATTFFIFDPSVLKLDSSAWVDTEANDKANSLAKQTAYAPETIWLKPGSSAFQYFANYDPTTGGVGSATDASSTVSFTNNDATEVKIAVNKVYKKGVYGTNLSANLRLNGSSSAPTARLRHGAARRRMSQPALRPRL